MAFHTALSISDFEGILHFRTFFWSGNTVEFLWMLDGI
jgi:hypothetical protein